MARKSAQLSFNRKTLLTQQYTNGFGGSYLKNSHAKTARPFSPNCAIHTVLKSRLARGPRSMLLNAKEIRRIIDKQAEKFHVKVYRFQNVGNHLHIITKCRRKKDFQNFLRTIANLIARLITGAQKSNPLNQSIKMTNTVARLGFWDQRPFTRLIHWGQDFENMVRYIAKNGIEAIGFKTNTARALVRLGLRPLSG